MNKKLNTIALATSLASLGFCSLSFGWQTDSSSLIGTGVTGANKVMQSVDTVLPPIVSTSEALASKAENLPPIISGKLIQQASAQLPGISTDKLSTFSQGGGLKPLNSIMTPKAPNVYRKPAPPKRPVARVAKAAQPVAPQPAAQGSGTRAGSGTRSVLSEIGQDYANGNYGGSPQQSVLPDVTQSSLDRSFRATETYVAPNQNGPDQYAAPQPQPTQGFADGTSYFDQNAAAFGAPAPAAGNCATCGNGLVDGSCSTCGGQGNGGVAVPDGPIIRDYGTFGSVSAANRYLYIDALGFTRSDGDIENSNFGTLNDFDFTSGFRVTFGTRQDSVSGRELSFFGLPGVSQEISQSDPLINTAFPQDQGGRLTAFIVPVTGAPADAFTGATFQSQRKDTDLYAVEFNQVNWGWDLIKTFTGVRYLSFQDSYNVQSTSNRTSPPDALGNVLTEEIDGDFTLDASNTLVGLHVGGEIFYDVGYRWSASAFGKFGIFANSSDFDTNFNNGDFNVSSESENFTVSSVAEIGALVHYQIRTNLRFRAGYQGFFIGNLATASDNLGISSGLFTGAEASDSDDVFFNGFNFGLEIYR